MGGRVEDDPLTDSDIHGVSLSETAKSVQAATLVVVLKYVHKTCTQRRQQFYVASAM